VIIPWRTDNTLWLVRYCWQNKIVWAQLFKCWSALYSDWCNFVFPVSRKYSHLLSLDMS